MVAFCGELAPSGNPLAGQGCNLRPLHSGRHSWETEEEFLERTCPDPAPEGSSKTDCGGVESGAAAERSSSVETRSGSTRATGTEASSAVRPDSITVGAPTRCANSANDALAGVAPGPQSPVVGGALSQCREFRAGGAWVSTADGGGTRLCGDPACGLPYRAHSPESVKAGLHSECLRKLGWDVSPGPFNPWAPPRKPSDSSGQLPVLGAREATHGAAARTSALYSAENPLKYAIDMARAKLARIRSGDPFHLDHWVDLEGYARMAQQIILEREIQRRLKAGAGANGKAEA